MAARRQAKGQEAMAKYNAEVMAREAAEKRKASLEEQKTRRERMRQTLKTRRALYAKAGVLMEGSPMETQLQAAEYMAEDIAELSRSMEVQARRFESQAALDVYRGRAARAAGRLGVATSLVGGVSDISRLGLSYHLAKKKPG